MKNFLFLTLCFVSLFLVGCWETPETKECKENWIPLLKCTGWVAG
jgi:hypothetical protein